MDVTLRSQRKRRAYLYLAITIITGLLSYYNGYRMGRTVEEKKWIDSLTQDVKKS